jgi:hypothetical protein
MIRNKHEKEIYMIEIFITCVMEGKYLMSVRKVIILGALYSKT